MSGDPFLPRLCRVTRVRRETRDTVTLDLVPADGNPLPPFTPGQFQMLYAFGVGEVPISLSGDPGRSDRRTHTVRAVGAVTRALARLRPGDPVGVRGPFGRGWPLKGAEGMDLVLVAGGLGLAPLRPALYAVLARRSAFGRVALLYGARTPADLLYRRELERWRGRADLQVEVTVDRADPSWRGDVGAVPRLLERVPLEPGKTLALLCGPEGMMRFTARALLERGVPPERVFVSLERNMQCAVALCGHCQLGPTLVCRDGPVYSWKEVEPLLGVREV